MEDYDVGSLYVTQKRSGNIRIGAVLSLPIVCGHSGPFALKGARMVACFYIRILISLIR